MPNYYVNLPAAQGRNALLDFSPLNNAFANIQQQNNLDRQRQDTLDERTYQRGRDAKQDARQATADNATQVQRLGQMASAYDRLQGPQRTAALQRLLSQHPNAAELGPEYHNPETAFKLIAADAGQWRDPREDQMKDLKLQAAQSELANAPLDRRYREAQITALETKENDPIKEFLLRSLEGSSSGAGGGPSLQPQSVPQGMTVPQTGMLPISNTQAAPAPQQQSGLQLVSDTAAPGAAPTGDMVDTPFGPMTRGKARQLGGAMLLDPKYTAAGKAILDSLGKEGPAGISKTAQNKMDETTVSAASTLGRLDSIRQQFKPEFQQIPTRLKLYGASWNSAFGGKLDPKMESQLRDFAEYKATAFDNFNQLLKELSGTAVSAQELQRQKIVQPNPGEGLFDGDDPVTLQAKMDRGIKIARSAIARMNYMRSRGLEFNKDTAEQFMKLQDVPAAIDKRGAEIEREIRRQNPKADKMSIERDVQSQLKQEFGI